MAGSQLKKRTQANTASGTERMPLIQKKHRPRTVAWDEVSQYQRENKYILTGYRLDPADHWEILTSLTFLHNETCNVYTHLIGALLLPLIAATFVQVLSDPRFFGVSGIDYMMFGIFFGCADCCLIFSATYHLMGPHSYDAEKFWHRMDLLGIVIVVTGTFIPGINYIFTCESKLQFLHWYIIMVSGSSTAALVCIPRFANWRTLRVSAYVALGAPSSIPILHGVRLYGLDYMLLYSGLRWYLLELAFYAGGVGLYGFRCPERFAPGLFDIWGSSHQIFHLFILFAMYTHAVALTEAFTAYHSLNLCEIKAAYRAGRQ